MTLASDPLVQRNSGAQSPAFPSVASSVSGGQLNIWSISSDCEFVTGLEIIILSNGALYETRLFQPRLSNIHNYVQDVMS